MECSEVKVKVTQNKTTPVKYRYLKNVLKYSNEVVVLRYWPPLSMIYCLQIQCVYDSVTGSYNLSWVCVCSPSEPPLELQLPPLIAILCQANQQQVSESVHTRFSVAMTASLSHN